jgi:peroxiredoxin
MNIIYRASGEICSSSKFNIHSINEIIVYGSDWTDTDFIANYDVVIDGERMTLGDAFRRCLVIPDDENVYFREATSEEVVDGKHWY